MGRSSCRRAGGGSYPAVIAGRPEAGDPATIEPDQPSGTCSVRTPPWARGIRQAERDHPAAFGRRGEGDRLGLVGGCRGSGGASSVIEWTRCRSGLRLAGEVKFPHAAESASRGSRSRAGDAEGRAPRTLSTVTSGVHLTMIRTIARTSTLPYRAPRSPERSEEPVEGSAQLRRVAAMPVRRPRRRAAATPPTSTRTAPPRGGTDRLRQVATTCRSDGIVANEERRLGAPRQPHAPSSRRGRRCSPDCPTAVGGPRAGVEEDEPESSSRQIEQVLGRAIEPLGWARSEELSTGGRLVRRLRWELGECGRATSGVEVNVNVAEEPRRGPVAPDVSKL